MIKIVVWILTQKHYIGRQEYNFNYGRLIRLSEMVRIRMEKPRDGEKRFPEKK
jgi:hypothetical protein